MSTQSRRSFIVSGSVGVAGAAILPTSLASASIKESSKNKREAPESTLVRDFVGACHARIDTVRDMLKEHPDLAKSAWDWGFGDYETAIGACSHTGRKDIIELLLAHGARPTIFTLATLDKHAAVRGFIDSMPNARNIEGPHSISLYRHAQAGNAKRVMQFLEREGLDSMGPSVQCDPDLADRYTGLYKFDPDDQPDARVSWVDRFDCLGITMGDGNTRNLIPMSGMGGNQNQAHYTFRPVGSSGARIILSGNASIIIQHAGHELVGQRVSQ